MSSMKYTAIITKTLYGEIIVSAKDKDYAEIRARDVVQFDNYNWVKKQKIDIHEIHEIPMICTKCGTKLPKESKFCNMCGEKYECFDVDLGRVYTEQFDKSSQTTTIFYKLYDGFDTIFLKNVFSICKYKTESKNPLVSVSFYIKCSEYTDAGVIKSNMNITDIKNRYCGQWFSTYMDKDDYQYSVIYSLIADSFENSKYDAYGDYFFDKPIEFWAKANPYGDKSGGSSKFHIVGVNFNI